ncbi:MAG: chorismate-binding protein [Oligoflexales bacterium]
MNVQNHKMPQNFYVDLLDRVGNSDVGIVFGGGQKRHVIVGLKFSEVDPQIVSKLSLCAAKAPLGAMPCQSGIFGLLSYDDMVAKKVVQSRFFALHKFVVIDRKAGRYSIVDNGEVASEFDCSHILDATTGLRVTEAAAQRLEPTHSDADYLASVERVLADIRSGRYYQLNLIRQFRFVSTPSHTDIAARYAQYSGNQGCWLKVPGLEVVSFSPETFLTYQREAEASVLSAWPIKGTIPRGYDPESDALRLDTLLRSAKDDAELSIIIDLMRNDLNVVCQRGSVRVAQSKSVRKTRTVHHLEAKISGVLANPTPLMDLFGVVGPCGSITGAPKAEVIKAIGEFEPSRRGFFMGSAFLFDSLLGTLDSSILIRTIVNSNGTYRYAAGSGIVVSSDPQSELEEVNAKCAILTQHHSHLTAEEEERIYPV